MELLRGEGIEESLLRDVEHFRNKYASSDEYARRIPKPDYFYYGKAIWKKALAALLEGENLLLTGPKATGKNVLAENLAAVLGRPEWNVSFHINVDASYLIGADTYNGKEVIFRPGPITLSAENGASPFWMKSTWPRMRRLPYCTPFSTTGVSLTFPVTAGLMCIRRHGS